MRGLVLEGASWDGGAMALGGEVRVLFRGSTREECCRREDPIVSRALHHRGIARHPTAQKAHTTDTRRRAALGGELRTRMPPARMWWERGGGEADGGGDDGGDGSGGGGGGARSLVATVPLYLTTSRAQLLVSVALPRRAAVETAALYQRGVALVAWG